MDSKDFESMISGLEDALAYAKGKPSAGTRAHKLKIDRSFIAETRLKAGLTQEEFAKVTGASLGTVRKWERGERSPSGAAGMLVRILARDPALVIQEAGIGERTRRKGQRRAKTAA